VWGMGRGEGGRVYGDKGQRHRVNVFVAWCVDADAVRVCCCRCCSSHHLHDTMFGRQLCAGSALCTILQQGTINAPH
jgi:hypothetical protein